MTNDWRRGVATLALVAVGCSELETRGSRPSGTAANGPLFDAATDATAAESGPTSGGDAATDGGIRSDGASEAETAGGSPEAGSGVGEAGPGVKDAGSHLEDAGPDANDARPEMDASLDAADASPDAGDTDSDVAVEDASTVDTDGPATGESQFLCQACVSDADCGELKCDTGLGYTFTSTPSYVQTGLTVPCANGTTGCRSDTLPGTDNRAARSGYCVDPGASVAAPDGQGRIASVATRLLVAVRDPATPNQVVAARPWLTTRFMNVTATTVTRFTAAADPTSNDYRTAAAPPAEDAKVLLFGRPGFVGVAADARSAHLYLAYAELPEPAGGGDPRFQWEPQYFTHVDDQGTPHFSANQTDAAPLARGAAT